MVMGSDAGVTVGVTAGVEAGVTAAAADTAGDTGGDTVPGFTEVGVTVSAGGDCLAGVDVTGEVIPLLGVSAGVGNTGWVGVGAVLLGVVGSEGAAVLEPVTG